MHCHFCHHTLSSKFDARAIIGWDWFTGNRDSTIHVCPDCVTLHHADIQRLRAEANVMA